MMKRMLIGLCLAVTAALSMTGSATAAEREYREMPLFSIMEASEATGTLHLAVDAIELNRLGEDMPYVTVRVPMLGEAPLELELEQFSILTPDAKVYRGGDRVTPEPVLMYRGTIEGEPHSLAYISVSEAGLLNGYVLRTAGQPVWLATPVATIGSGERLVTVTTGEFGDLPDFAEFCGTTIDMDALARQQAAPAGQFADQAGVQVAVIGVDSDQQFADLFGGNAVAAEAYMQQLVGAISTIYERDLNMKLLIGFLRTWPFGGEPFEASNLSGFRDHWNDNEDTTGLNVIHMLSGSRTTSYGGVAYVGGTCGSDFRYGIDGYLNGSFPTNYNESSFGNWDIIVMAHEMGHNFGTFHTHDISDYDPLIDSCAQGFYSRGTIMSYCHSAPGYTLNTDMRFHQRVQEVIGVQIAGAGCHWYDCNGNNINDSIDIANVTSLDSNLDGIPDECQDCNGNSILDPVETIGGVGDVNGNGIPDECEVDCDQNGLPDEYETRNGLTADTNGNGIPDTCEPDCNGNLIADHTEISGDLSIDLDRDLVLDECEDCNNNGTSDWQDIERAGNLYILSADGYVREYLGVSGVPIQNLGTGVLTSPVDLAIGPDRLLYVSDQPTGQIYRIDPATGVATLFFVGGAIEPGPITFGPDGDLYVGDLGDEHIYRLDGSSGALIGIFANSGATGLFDPSDLEFGPNGNLFALNSNNSVLEFDGVSGGSVGTFVAPGSGGLDNALNMAFLAASEHLLVTSNTTNQILEFDTTGALVGQFNDSLDLNDPWGLEIGPDSNVYIMRRGGSVRLLRMLQENGRYSRAFVRNDPGLSNPTVVAFMPPSAFDCNRNYEPDECDIALGVSEDVNLDMVPDECSGDCCVGFTGNVNNDPADDVNLTDLTVLVNHLFVTFQPLLCPGEANTNGDGAGVISLTDLTLLVNHLFVTFEELSVCQ